MAKTIDGKVYNDNGAYLGHSDIVYGTGPIGKEKNKGITTGLDSSATKKPQPSKSFNAGSNSIPGADPNQPSINNATRREQYAIQSQGPTVPKYTESNVPSYISTPTDITSKTPNLEQTAGVIKEKTGTFSTEGGDSALAQVKDIYSKQGLDGLKSMYGELTAEAYESLLQNMYDQGALINAQTGVLNTQSPDVQNVIDLMKEVQMARVLGYTTAKDIANKLGQDERVIQKIMNGQASELITLNQEFKERQLRQYYQAEEDLGKQIARNMEDYQNRKTNADYQFNSAIQTIERNLFDSERAAKTSSAIFGMTGTRYMIDRIKTQYQQQMDDLNNTYQYQSATAQLSINRALEDFATNMERLGIEEDEATKALQAQVMETMTNLNNQVGLTVQQQATILSNLQTNIAKMKAEGMTQRLSSLENGYTDLSQKIADAYGLGDMTTKQFTSQELGRTSTSIIGNDTNNLGHILASDDGTRIGTYKSPNGYTYNVYATREDGLLATQGLLQKAYYGKTLKDAAQKWIGQGKDISGALAVLKEKGLDPNAILSDENVRKFMEAIGRREGTLKPGETLEQRAAQGKTLEGYKTESQDTASMAEYDAEVNNKYNILSLLKEELEAVDFSQNLKKLLKSTGERSNVKSLDAYDTLYKGGIRTIGALFTQAVDVGAQYNKQAIALISGAPIAMGALDTVVTDFSRIYNKNFIEYLIDSKGQGATFGNLTEGEGSKILSAANEMSAWMSQDDLLKRINNALNLMDGRRKSNKEEQDVTPEIVTEEEGLEIIEDQFGPDVTISPL